MRTARLVVLFVLSALLTGCAGRNFVGPTPESLVLGQTMRREVVERLGRPESTGTITKNGRSLTTATYVRAGGFGVPAGVSIVPIRVLTLYFWNEVLVGHEFKSSFATDHTDFDESQVQRVQAGVTTGAVVALLGPPHGRYRYPLTKNESSEALVYLHERVKVQPTFLSHRITVSRKILVVSYDSRNDVVTDVDFSASANR